MLNGFVFIYKNKEKIIKKKEGGLRHGKSKRNGKRQMDTIYKGTS